MLEADIVARDAFHFTWRTTAFVSNEDCEREEGTAARHAYGVGSAPGLHFLEMAVARLCSHDLHPNKQYRLETRVCSVAYSSHAHACASWKIPLASKRARCSCHSPARLPEGRKMNAQDTTIQTWRSCSPPTMTTRTASCPDGGRGRRVRAAL